MRAKLVMLNVFKAAVKTCFNVLVNKPMNRMAQVRKCIKHFNEWGGGVKVLLWMFYVYALTLSTYHISQNVCAIAYSELHICFKHYILGYLNYASDKLTCFFSREETTRADILSSPKNIETDITILHIYIFVKFFNTKVWKKYKIFLLCGPTNIRGLRAKSKESCGLGGGMFYMYICCIYI